MFKENLSLKMYRLLYQAARRSLLLEDLAAGKASRIEIISTEHMSDKEFHASSYLSLFFFFSKTTIVRLLYRFFEPQSGSIYINGHDVRDMDLEDLRNCISIVPQV